jgi:hypothetical protein
VPKSVEASRESTVNMTWNQQVRNDRTIPNFKPDITIRDNDKGTRVLINIAISGDRNLIKTQAAKILKYKYLKVERELMCKVRRK